MIKNPKRFDPPKIRVGTPGTAFGNVGIHVQLSEYSRLQYGVPEPTRVKVIIWEIDTQVYLLFGCAREPGPDVYELTFESSTTRAPTVRGLKPPMRCLRLAGETFCHREYSTIYWRR